MGNSSGSSWFNQACAKYYTNLSTLVIWWDPAENKDFEALVRLQAHLLVDIEFAIKNAPSDSSDGLCALLSSLLDPKFEEREKEVLWIRGLSRNSLIVAGLRRDLVRRAFFESEAAKRKRMTTLFARAEEQK